MPRVRVLCALTGELIYEPTHPWLEQVRCHLLKKWTWINKGIYLPTALTLFYLHFEVDQQPVDDFQCLGDLALGRPLDIQCFAKAPQRPDIRHRKRLEDAIEQLQGQRLWSLLTRYRPPSLLRDRRGNQLNPLLLALQAGQLGQVVQLRASVHFQYYLTYTAIPMYWERLSNPRFFMQLGSKTRKRLKIF